MDIKYTEVRLEPISKNHFGYEFFVLCSSVYKKYMVSLAWASVEKESIVTSTYIPGMRKYYVIDISAGVVSHKFHLPEGSSVADAVNEAYALVCADLGIDASTAETDPVAKDSEEDDMQQEENRKARQAAYTAKHREKAKALRRPEARDVAAAYMAVIESDALMQHVIANDAYVAREYPDASPAVVAEVRARSIVDFVRSKVIHDLTAEKGFNFEQVKDKVHSMVANTLTA